jgi:tetratricopeptide (TPR) repeat protein
MTRSFLTRTQTCFCAAALFCLPLLSVCGAEEPIGPAYFPSLVTQPPAPLAPSPTAFSPEVRGDILMARGQYVAAIHAYQEGPKDSAVVWNKIGMAYQHLFAIHEARGDYEKALHIQHRYPEVLNNLGTISFMEKDYGRAEKLYRKALKSEPNSAVIYSNLGTAYFAQNKSKKGVDAYRRAFSIDPLVFANPQSSIPSATSQQDRAREYYCLAELFAKAGMKDRAIEYLRKAFNEGFNNRRELMQDDEFATLRTSPDFAELMSR